MIFYNNINFIQFHIPSGHQTRQWTTHHLLLIFPAINLHLYVGEIKLLCFITNDKFHSSPP